MKRMAVSLLAFVMAAGMAPAAFAADKQEEKPKVAMNKITGEVSAASSSGIAVQYGSTKTAAKEIYLPVDKNTKFDRVAGASQLKYGDTVQVVYEQRYKEPEKGKKILMGATATQVVLLKNAAGEGALVSKKEEAR